MISLKQKNWLLLMGILILLWIAYQLSFSKTLDLKKQYSTLKTEVQLLENVSENLKHLEGKKVYYDSILKSEKINVGSSFQHGLLQIISTFSDSTNVKIIAFNSPHIFETENAIFSTFSFTISGGFSKITQLIYALEQQYKMGKILSVHFKKKKDYRRNRSFLECQVWLQNVQQEH